MSRRLIVEDHVLADEVVKLRYRITELEAALDIRDRTLREIHARPDAFAECIRRADRLEAALAVAEKALRSVQSLGLHEVDSALAALRPETEGTT